MVSRLALGLLVLAMLVGCASNVGQTPIWGFSGKMSVRTDNLSRVLSIDWTEYPDSTAISLSGPLGVPVAEITVNKNRIRVVADGRDRTFRNELPLVLADGAQLSFPWPDIRSWVRGKTVAGEPIEEQGLITGKWRVKVTEIGQFGPTKLLVEHESGRLTLKVQNWRTTN